MNVRCAAWRRADSAVGREPSGWPRVVSNRAREVGEAAPDLVVGPRLCGGAFEAQVRPERRADEADVVDGDGPGVEERHLVAPALVRERAAREVNLGAVVLVVPRDVEDALGPGPASRGLADPVGRHRGEVAREDDDARRWGRAGGGSCPGTRGGGRRGSGCRMSVAGSTAVAASWCIRLRPARGARFSRGSSPPAGSVRRRALGRAGAAGRGRPARSRAARRPR